MRQILILLILFLSGCATKTINSFYISTPNIDIPKLHSSKFANSVLKVSYPEGSSIYMGSRIYYTLGDRESYYKYSRWSDSANRMILSLVVESLQKSQIFKSVIDYSSDAKSDYMLESTIYSFRHIVNDSDSYAYLKIGFRLVDKSNNKIIKEKIFEYKEPCKTTDARGFIEATKEIFAKLSRELPLWIER